MEVQLIVESEKSTDQLLSLREWLMDVTELRGRVINMESPPPPGKLGPVLDALTLVLAPGGVAAAFVPALVAWIRERRSDVAVRITRPDGTQVEITAARVRDLDTSGLRAQVKELLKVLDENPEDSDKAVARHQSDGITVS